MSSFFDELKQGLNEAISIERGELTGKKSTYEIKPVKQYNNVQIKQIRQSAGMTQSLFATFMGVSAKTVEAWEKGTNHPTGTACRLLSLIEDKSFETLPFVKTSRI